MGSLNQNSYLGELTDRLYRALNLDGPIRASVQDSIQPVIVVSDGTLPGMGTQRGRRFAISPTAAGAVGAANYGFKATVDLVIERLSFFTDTAPTKCILRYLGPTESDPFAMTTGTGVFLDRAAASSELAPMGQGFNDGAAASGAQMFSGTPVAVNQAVEAICAPFFMLAGSKIIVRANGAGATLGVNIYGRSFG